MEQQDRTVVIERLSEQMVSIATRMENLMNENQHIFESISNDNSIPDTSINPPPPPTPESDIEGIPPPPSTSPPSTPSESPIPPPPPFPDHLIHNPPSIPEIGDDQNENMDIQDNQPNENDSFILEDASFFSMVERLINNRHNGLSPIRFMSIMGKFVLDPETALFRIPRTQDNNIDNRMVDIYQFDDEISCDYCREIVDNDLNSYLQHIIDSNHIQEQININNDMVNSLQEQEQDQDQVQQPNVNQNYDSQQVNLTVEDVVDFVSHLTPHALEAINDSLACNGYPDFDPESVDQNESQEYRQNLLNYVTEQYGNPVIVPLDHLNIDRIAHDSGIENAPPLNDPNMPPFMNSLNEAIQAYMQVHNGNRFANIIPQLQQDDYDSEDDSEGTNDYSPIRRNGLELSEHSTEYEIGIDTTCGICLETYKAVDKTKFNILLCMHQYCNECTKKWFSRNVICPNCKTDLRQLRSINLNEIGLGTF